MKVVLPAQTVNVDTPTGGVDPIWYEKLQALATGTGTPGPPGAAGPAGPAGPPGPSGTGIYVNIMDHGGNNTNTADNTAALAAAFGALPVSTGLNSGGGTIYFPPGTYRFNSTPTLTVGPANTRATLRLLGDANMATQFYFPTNAGIVIATPGGFAQQQVHVEHIAFLAGQRGGGTALKLFNTGVNADCNMQFTWLSSVEHCSFGPYNPTFGVGSSFYWNVGLEILAWHQVDVAHCIFRGDWNLPRVSTDPQSHGTGVWLHATGVQPSGGTTQFGLLYNFHSCLWETLNIGLYYGSYIQGVTVSGSNFNGGNGTAGIYIGGAVVGLAGDVLQSQLAVVNCQFAWGSNSIRGDTLCYQISCVGCIFTAWFPDSICITLFQSNMTQITGNSFNCSVGPTGNTTTAIVIDGIGAATIIGNTFIGFAVAYNWKPSTTHCKGQSNAFTDIWTVPFINSGASIAPGTAGP